MRVNVELLKEEMDKKSLSIGELSRLSGIDKSTISRLLSEERQFSVNTALALVMAMKIPSTKAGRIFFSN